MKGRIRRENSYEKSWRFLKESRYFFLFVAVIFVVSALIGFFYPKFLVELIMSLIKELADKTKGMNFFQLFVFILENNLTTAFTGLILGLIFGIIPFLLIIFNGYVLGFVAGKTSGVLGYSVLWRLLPHGVFEMPALIISLGLGMKLASFILAKNKKKQLVYDLENSFRVFLYVVLPLLLVAAVIEAGLIVLLG